MKFSDFPQAVIKENVDYTVKEITNVIKKYGPRESGNENCYAAQKHIKKEMDTFCDGTEFESYKMAPKAFLHFTKLVSVVISCLCNFNVYKYYYTSFGAMYCLRRCFCRSFYHRYGIFAL